MLLIRSAAVFSAGRTETGRDVLIGDDGLIAEVGVGIAAPGARVIEARGKTLLPGLIDCHVHIGMSDGSPETARASESAPAAALVGARALQRSLRAGFTTVRSLGGVAGAETELSRAQRRGVVPGARLISVGQALCITGGHGHQHGREVDGADDARKAVREQLKSGAEAIKVIATGGIMTEGVEPGNAQLTIDELESAVGEAHRAGVRTAAHAQGRTGIANVLQVGIGSVEHGIYLDDELIAQMIAQGTFLCPTLIAATRLLEHSSEASAPPWAIAKATAVRETRQRNIGNAFDSGVRVAFGTDAGTPFNPHGSNAGEFELLMQYGLTPAQALTAATSNAAENIGWGDRLGRVESGYIADLLLVDGDPLADLGRISRSIDTVIQAGEPIWRPGAPTASFA